MTVGLGGMFVLFGCLEILRFLLARLASERVGLIRYQASICWIPFLRLWRRIASREGLLPGSVPPRKAGSLDERLRTSRIFVVGPLSYGSTGWGRLEALRRIFGEAGSLNIDPWSQGLSFGKHLMANHFYSGPALRGINTALREQVRVFRPDILWVDKGIHIMAETLAEIAREGRPLLISYSPDQQMALQNQSRHYLMSLALYDVHITTKPGNVSWLKRCGGRRVEYIGNGFCPELHRPMSLTPEEEEMYGCDIGFIGRCEPSREELLFRLWEQGYRVKVWGGGWEEAKRRKHPLFQNASQRVGEEYAKAVCGTKINLGFLSTWYGDVTTTRSVEIPACGRFLLGERTQEHTGLFREGIEAEFYSTREELFEKTAYYLQHEEERETITRAGQARCIAHYSNDSCLRGVLGRILG